MHGQVESLEAELSAARKSAAGSTTELAELAKRLSDSMGHTAKLDDKVRGQLHTSNALGFCFLLAGVTKLAKH